MFHLDINLGQILTILAISVVGWHLTQALTIMKVQHSLMWDDFKTRKGLKALDHAMSKET